MTDRAESARERLAKALCEKYGDGEHWRGWLEDAASILAALSSEEGERVRLSGPVSRRGYVTGRVQDLVVRVEPSHEECLRLNDLLQPGTQATLTFHDTPPESPERGAGAETTCSRCGHAPRYHAGFSEGCIDVVDGSFCGCPGWNGKWDNRPPATPQPPEGESGEKARALAEWIEMEAGCDTPPSAVYLSRSQLDDLLDILRTPEPTRPEGEADLRERIWGGFRRAPRY